MKSRFYFYLALVVCAFLTPGSQAQDTETYELPPINYSHTQPQDVVSRLQADIASGKVKLQGSDQHILLTLLSRLKIPVASQLLVFSRTSFQRDRIRPEHPRALYYTDNCYVGWVPGGLVEITAIDPRLGPVFYSFDPREPVEKGKPAIARDSDCLRCHGANFVPGIPSVFARSLYPDKEGEPLFRQGSLVVDYRTPFSDRWGGWYVTGTHGKAVHRGNNFASEDKEQLVFNPARGANITNLANFFATNDYLTNSSDIVSLLIFEHQLAMQNALTHAGMNCRHMLDYQKHLQQELKVPLDEEPSFESVRSVFKHCAEEVVDNLLFKDEATLPEGITGSADFQKAFVADVPRSADGASLKDLEISDHLFKNRCSYLIYSESFLSLPEPLKRRVYARLAQALDAEQPDARYNYIHQSERKRIAMILRETHAEFRGYRLNAR